MTSTYFSNFSSFAGFSIALNIFEAIIAFFIVIGVHEWGHFIVARRFGVVVERINFGFGKQLWSKKSKDGIEYGVSLFLLGGYVQLFNPSLMAQRAWKRCLILVAGPMANFLLAFVLFFFAFSSGLPLFKPVVGEVISASLAQKAGFEVGDKLLEINQKPVSDWIFINFDLVKAFGEKGWLQFTVEQPNGSMNKSGHFYSDLEHVQTLKIDLSEWKIDPLNPDLLGSLGVKPSLDPQWKTIKIEKPMTALASSWSYLYHYAELNAVVIYKIAKKTLSIHSLAGPIALWNMSMESAKAGLLFYCFFVSIMSVSVGFFNILPIPGLDGFYVLLLGIEKIIGRPISLAAQALICQLGWIALALLVVQVVLNDLARVLHGV